MRLKIRCYENECEQIARVQFIHETNSSIYCCVRHHVELIKPAELTQFGWIMSLEHKGWREIREGYQSMSYEPCYDCLCEMERKPRMRRNTISGDNDGPDSCWVCYCEHKARLAAWKDSLNINVGVAENPALYDEVALNFWRRG